MSWFLSKIVYRIICGDGNHIAQFDEQLRLVQAANRQQAFEKAYGIGQAEQISFMNDRAQLVQWKFIDVCDVYQLNEIVDGTEIYSRIEEKDDAAVYEAIVHTKAGFLAQEIDTPHLQAV